MALFFPAAPKSPRCVSTIGILFVFVVSVWGGPTEEQDLEELSFAPPEFTEEEERSQVFPDRQELRCDACGLIAQNWAASLSQFESMRSRPLPESDLMSIFEHVCRKSVSDQYGAKQVDGKTRLAGPGAYADGKPGFIVHGGKWGYRIRDACIRLLGELGDETDVYAKFVKYVKTTDVANPSRFSQVEAFLRDICMAKESGGKKKAKKQSVQAVQRTCSAELFYFADKDWQNVQKLWETQHAKVDL